MSVVLPTYNQAHYLPEALNGILDQTFKDFELIVVNDGSTDNTSQVLEKYQQKLDIIVIQQENQGLPRALNSGFAQARGDYLTWTSSDNITLPNMFEVLYSALECDPSVGVVYADWFFINDGGETLSLYKSLDYDRYLLLYQNYVHCCFLFRKECLERVGGYDPEFIYSEDWEFWIRVSRYFRMKRIPQPLYKYRIHPKSMTTDVLEGTTQKNISYLEFKKRLSYVSPLEWYYSKIKWRLLTLKLGSDPRQAWQEAINDYEIS
ncbi:glycosyltransferase family 2 protein [Chloroflexota bacterium]